MKCSHIKICRSKGSSTRGFASCLSHKWASSVCITELRSLSVSSRGVWDSSSSIWHNDKRSERGKSSSRRLTSPSSSKSSVRNPQRTRERLCNFRECSAIFWSGYSALGPEASSSQGHVVLTARVDINGAGVCRGLTRSIGLADC